QQWCALFALFPKSPAGDRNTATTLVPANGWCNGTEFQTRHRLVLGFGGRGQSLVRCFPTAACETGLQFREAREEPMPELTGPRGYWKCDRDCDCREYFERLLRLAETGKPGLWVLKELMFTLNYICGCRLKGNRRWAQEARDRYYELQ